MKINGIVLAAGYGSRMAPLTGQVPKPVLPLAGVPLILRILERMTRVEGIGRIAVNSHHLKEKVEKCVQESSFRDRAELFYEDEILGTGGPLVNAKSLLADCDAFLLHNGDIACDADLNELVRFHLKSGAVATMLLRDGPENRVLAENGEVLDILGKLKHAVTGKSILATYCGVSVYSPEFFSCLPKEPVNASLPDAWLRALRAGKKIAAYFPDENFFWNDIGSFDQYFSAQESVMLKNESGFEKTGPFTVGKNCEIDPKAEFSGFVSIGDGCKIASGTHLHNCVLLPGARVRKGYSAWEVFGRTFSCHRDMNKLAKLPILKENIIGEWHPVSLPEQGSDRKFYRIAENSDDGVSRILMISNERDADFDRFLNLGDFFFRNNLKTPEIYAADKANYCVLMEDLGDGTVSNKMRDGEKNPEKLYSDVIDALADFQVRGTRAIGGEDREFRIFTHRLLRWESDYFRENFLKKLCGIQFGEQEEKAIVSEFEKIACAAETMPYTLIHRDFQSQNILVQNGVVRFVDFQGARLGPYTYDVSSLVKDPYVKLSQELRGKLFAHHRLALAEAGLSVPEETHILHTVVASLQRNMQALGAYGFLSLTKGKKKYLDSVRPGLDLLLDGLRRAADFREGNIQTAVLREFCEKASETLEARIRAAKEDIQS